MNTGWLDPILKQELGENSFWVHNTGYLDKPLSTKMGVAGHVTSKKEHGNFYQNVLKADLEVVKWVKFGYELNLSEWPKASYLENNKSSLQEPEFVWNELRRLCKLGVMSEVQERPHVINPLSVVDSNKKRLVWDARELNKLINTAKLPLETLDDAVELLEKDFYGGSSDLEAGYFQVRVVVEEN